MNVNFYLESRTDKKGLARIFVYVTIDNKIIKVATGKKIEPKYWNSKKQEVKSTYPNSIEFNQLKLGVLKSEINKAYEALISSDNLSLLTFKAEVKEIVEGRKQKQKIDHQEKAKGFYDFYDLYIESQRHKVTNSRIGMYSTFKKHIESFEKIKKYPIAYETINMTFYDSFLSYLSSDLGHNNNTVAKNIRILKAFMTWSVDREFTQNMVYKKFKAVEHEKEVIYLTWDELMHLQNLDLSSNARLDRVRDVFCFACYTGQRYSDVKTIKRNDIRGDQWFVRTQKTKDSICVPLNTFALSILSKYLNDKKPLPVISEQNMNLYIKELGKIAGFDSEITMYSYKGAKRIEKVMPKHELLSTHAARKTFVTLSLEKGAKTETIMSITGQKKYSTFKKYFKITNQVKKAEMDKVWS